LKLSGENILVVSNEPWSDVWFSKHNYAWELSKNNTVYFVNSPSNWKLSNLFSCEFSIKSINENLSVVSIQNTLPSTFNFLKEINNYITGKRLVKRIPGFKSGKFILWNFTPLFLFRPNLLPLKKSVFHIVDQNWTTFYGTSILASIADHLIIVSDKILSEYKEHMSKSLVIGHGISEDEFNIDSSILSSKREELKAYGNFGLFVGSIDIRLDFEFINLLTVKCQSINFVFIGPLNIKPSHPYYSLFTTSSNNIFHIGPRHYKELKYYIRLSSFCITPMDITFPGNNIAHHKTLPFLAQGKHIFSPMFLDYSSMKHLMTLENNKAELINKINSFKGNETDEIINSRKAYAKEQSYNNHLSKIADFFNETHSNNHIQ